MVLDCLKNLLHLPFSGSTRASCIRTLNTNRLPLCVCVFHDLQIVLHNKVSKAHLPFQTEKFELTHKSKGEKFWAEIGKFIICQLMLDCLLNHFQCFFTLIFDFGTNHSKNCKELHIYRPVPVAKAKFCNPLLSQLQWPCRNR